jgi:hypothetical protein
MQRAAYIIAFIAVLREAINQGSLCYNRFLETAVVLSSNFKILITAWTSISVISAAGGNFHG